MENRRELPGLSATALKLIALVIMTIDHIGAYWGDLPLFSPIRGDLRLVGRIAAPIFLFCLVESLRYTRDRGRFLKRMYIASVCAGLPGALIGWALGCSFGNIFQSFAWTTLWVMAAEGALAGLKEKNLKKALKGPLLLLLLTVLVCLAEKFAYALGRQGFELARALIFAFVRSPLEVEYSLGIIVLGFVWYFIPSKLWRCALLSLLCVLAWFQPWGYMNYLGMFSGIQWAMIGAVPFLLLYNGRRGRGMKWLFYVYYPVHTWLMALVWALLKK